MAWRNRSEGFQDMLREIESRWIRPLFDWFQPEPIPGYTFEDGSNYVGIDNLGVRGYGKFSLCRDCSNRKIVILKDIPLSHMRGNIQIIIRNQVPLIEELDHPNIVRLLNSKVNDRFIWLIFEKLACNLKDFVAFQDYTFRPQIAKSYLHQMLSAVAYCHARRILHRNLTPEGIQIDIIEKKVKVDFGRAVPTRVPDATNTYCVGTRGYRAPEILLTSLEHSTAIDVWSLACIFGEMVIGHKLFQAVADRQDELMQIFRICGTPTEETWPGFTEICTYDIHALPHYEPMDLRQVFPRLEPDGIDLLSKMLSLDPSRRISANDGLAHPYFNNLDSSTWQRVLDTIMFCCSSAD